MANVLFKKGTLANLGSVPKSEGTLYVTTDERAMYLDTSDSTRIRLGDFQEYASWTAIQALPAEKRISTVLYYAQAENILCKWTGTAWTQINPDTTIANTGASTSLTAATGGGVSIETTVTDSAGSVSTDHIIVGDGATTVSVLNNKVYVSSTDSHTTKAGHYTPAEESGSKLSAASNKAITGIKRDSLGHVTGIEETPFSDIVASATISGVDMGINSTNSSNNNIELETTVSAGGESETGSIKVAGSGATTVSYTAGTGNASDTITITSTDQSVADAAHHYKASGVAQGTKSASTSATGSAGADVYVVTGVTTDAAGHVTGVTSGKATDTLNGMDSISFTPTASNGNGYEVNAKTDADTAGASTTFDPIVTVGNGTTTDVHFIGGKATLPVYTKTQTDSAISTALAGASAMVIKGELSAANSTLPTTNVQAGDTYLVTYASGWTFGSEKAEAGDFFVAKADMASGSTNANWYHVPAGNDLAYFDAPASGAGIVLKTKADNIISGSLKFDSVASGNAGIVVTASHDTVDDYNETTITMNMQWGSF